MLAHGACLRQLHWYHAGPMLFGDWGTSRLYVLGLAFIHTGYSSFWYMAAMSVLLVAVGWCYQVICRLYPDGGGVYSSARHTSEMLAVVGALLLCADYVVTAALSAFDAFKYLGFEHQAGTLAAISILLVGLLNYFGPTKAGTVAMVVAILTILCSAVIACFSLDNLNHAVVVAPTETPTQSWTQFTRLILAISGVEAIANMTGIMVEPVEKTSKKSIFPVLIEIVVLNLILTLAMSAIPADYMSKFTHSQQEATMVSILADYYVGPVFAKVASVIFALLLLSAVNTAVTDLVSIQFMMSRDRELPSAFSGLNKFGMPVLGLVIGAIIPAIVVKIFPDVGQLSDLYAIGVVGAVAVNLGCCSLNRTLPMRKFERIMMFVLTIVMTAIWITIAVEKPHALVFATGIMSVGLSGRLIAKNYSTLRRWVVAPVPGLFGSDGPTLTSDAPSLLPLNTNNRDERALYATKRESDSNSRILVAARGQSKLLGYAFEEAKFRRAELLVLFVRYTAMAGYGPEIKLNAAEDAEATQLFAEAQRLAEANDVTYYPLFAVSHDVGDTVLDMAVTYGVNTVLLGATRRGALWKIMQGDVISQVASHLPESINLVIHS